MKTLIKTIAVLFCLQTMAQINCVTPEFNWGTAAENPNNHLVFLPDSLMANINGQGIEIGDYIGVFYPDDNGILQCASYEAWTGSESLGLFAYADNESSSEKDGFHPGDALSIKIWKSSGGIDFLLDTDFALPFEFGINDAGGIWTSNGISVVKGLDYQGGGNTNIQLSVLLEGPYIGNHELSTLRQNLLPLEAPYSNAPWNYVSTDEPSIDSIPDNVVDWVLVEAMTGTPGVNPSNMEVVERRLGFILEDGLLVDYFEEDQAGIAFQNLQWGSEYYFAVRHVNHMAILTSTPLTAAHNVCYDFTEGVDKAFGNIQQNLSNDGFAMMVAGDFYADGVIQVSDYDQWFADPATIGAYLPTDANLDGVVQNTDYDVWFLNKARVGIPEIQY